MSQISCTGENSKSIANAGITTLPAHLTYLTI